MLTVEICIVVFQKSENDVWFRSQEVHLSFWQRTKLIRPLLPTNHVLSSNSTPQSWQDRQDMDQPQATTDHTQVSHLTLQLSNIDLPPNF